MPGRLLRSFSRDQEYGPAFFRLFSLIQHSLPVSRRKGHQLGMLGNQIEVDGIQQHLLAG